MTLRILAVPAPDIQWLVQPTTLVDGMNVAGGRTHIFNINLSNVANVEITQQPSVGHLSVNPDNTLALVLTGSDHTGSLSFQFEVTFDDDSTQIVDRSVTVDPLTHNYGWATGESIYMLETDAQGDLVVEHGDDHRTLHVSGDGMDAQAVADHYNAANGTNLSASDIWAGWLIDNPEYGGSPELALNIALGEALWEEIIKEPSSNWLLLERGHQYDGLSVYPLGSAGGESELHPIYIGAYGEGTAPEMPSDTWWDLGPNVVVEGMQYSGDRLRLFDADQVILSDLRFDNVQVIVERTKDNAMEGITLRNSAVLDTVKVSPANTNWEGEIDKISALYVAGAEGLLVEGMLVDRVGWGEGYDVNGDAAFPQMPNKNSHNFYIQTGNNDITLRGNISMRAASWGAQIRPGGYVEDNLFIDNNAAFSTAYGSAPFDYFPFVSGNLITSGGGRDQEYQDAALTWGGGTSQPMGAMIGNIVAHMADPNNPDEVANKVGNGTNPGGTDAAYFNDTIVYNWLVESDNRNIDGLNTSTLDQTTIQNYTADVTGQPVDYNFTYDMTVTSPPIEQFAQYLRALPNNQFSSAAQDILDYFRQGFGIYEAPRSEAATLRFVPNDIGDGVRWDNRINWTTGDLPGTVSGDSVNLGGNRTIFATKTMSVADMVTGGGSITATSGRLNVTGATTGGGAITIRKVGQVWLNGYADSAQLDVTVEAGRFANTGTVSGHAHAAVSGGQFLLGYGASSYTIGSGSELTITGSTAKVGWDGTTGSASLTVASGGTLAFVADASGFSPIREVWSGANGDTATSIATSVTCGGTLTIDVDALGATTDTWTLVEADSISGSFGTVTVQNLPSDRDATVTVGATSITIQLAAGTGQTTVN